MRRADGDHRPGRAAEEEGQCVRVRRGPERETSVRRATTRGDGRDAENPSVGREVTKRKVRQRVQGVGPREAGANAGTRTRWPGTRGVPKDASDQEGVGVGGHQSRQRRSHEAEQVLVQRLALFGAPFPKQRESNRSVDE